MRNEIRKSFLGTPKMSKLEILSLLGYPTKHLSLSFVSRREMRHIETFFADEKSTKFILNKKQLTEASRFHPK